MLCGTTPAPTKPGQHPQVKKDVEKIQVKAAKMAKALWHMAFKKGWKELVLFRVAKRNLRAF